GSREIADGVFGKLLVEDNLIATFVVFGGVYGVAAFIGVARSIRSIARFGLLALVVLSCLFFIVFLVLTIAEYLIQRIVGFLFGFFLHPFFHGALSGTLGRLAEFLEKLGLRRLCAEYGNQY